MAIYFISDTHFNHANVIAYSSRPFADVPTMNEALIAAWNEVVSPSDTVYHLGDFAMGDRTLIPAILARLNGNLIMVAGNHDNKRDDKYFANTPIRPEALMLEIEGLRVECIHSPYQVQGLGDIALCGHVHEKWAYRAAGVEVPAYEAREHSDAACTKSVPIYNVGVDVRGYRPRTLAEIMDAHV